MKHYVGLDVSLKETSVCIVDDTGAVCREVKVLSHPEDLAQVLQDPAWQLVRVGLEAGPLSQWLFSELVQAGLPVICIETRHAKAFLKAQVNKSDRYRQVGGWSACGIGSGRVGRWDDDSCSPPLCRASLPARDHQPRRSEERRVGEECRSR